MKSYNVCLRKSESPQIHNILVATLFTYYYKKKKNSSKFDRKAVYYDFKHKPKGRTIFVNFLLSGWLNTYTQSNFNKL